MATLPPRRNPTPTKISKQHLTPLQILLQMGFPKHRAEKALAATGQRGVQLASDWLLAHVNDPLLDDNSPRDYILYACPTGPFLQQLQNFWEKSLNLCGWNGAHNYIPHITLVSFFKAPDEDALHLAQGLKSVMDRHGATLNEQLKLETYTSPNFMGFFVAEEHADYLKRIAMQYVKEVSNAIISDTYEHFDALTACFPWCTTTTARCIPRGSRSISVEPHVKSLHLSLAYQFPSSQFANLKSLVDELDPQMPCDWEIRLYSRDPRINSKQVHKIIHTYTPTECDELDLRSGDYVYISSEALSNSPDGWVEGTSWLTGLSGLLPESYTQRTAETDAWTLHKKISLTHTPEAKHSTQKPTQVQTSNSKDHSVFNNHEIKEPTLPPDFESWIAEAEEKARGGGEENLYENLLAIKKKKSEDEEMKGTNQRNVLIMRHGERIDFTFGSWLPFCYDEAGNYIQRDLNLPKTLPARKDGPKGYLRDSPLTNVGIFTASVIGEAILEKNISIDDVYCSPSFRCIQTCSAFLEAINKKDELKIKIEPGLFGLVWYPENLPDWMSVEELIKAGYNIDENYQPFVTEKELRETKETCEQFYLRSAFVSRESFEKAKKKLKMLETESDVDTDSSANIKRKSIPSGRLQDYVLSDSDDSNGIPSIPHPPVVQKNIRRLSQVSEAAENSFTQLNNNNEVCTNCNSSYELLMELYKKQEKYMLELNEKLDYLTGLMQNNVFSEDRTVGQDVILPVETLQDLQNLDNEFLDNPDKYNQYLDVLKLVGGKDCSDTTRRVMAKLLGHELALTINWSGRNEKPAFHSLKEVVKLICDAVKLNPICKTYTTSLVEMAIKAWLRGACDRNGGRSNRKK